MAAGSRYAATRHLAVKDLAPLIRTEVRAHITAAVVAGTVPAGAKVSVRYTTGSTESVVVTVVVPAGWCVVYDKYGNASHTAQSRDLGKSLRQIADAYNQTASAPGGDPHYRRFYASANVCEA